MAKANRRTAAEKEQPQLPGTEDEKNPKVHKFGLIALDAKEDAALAKRKEKETYGNLLAVMVAEKVKTYKVGTIDASVDLKPKLKLKRITAEKKEKKTRAKKQSAGEETNKPDLKIA